MAAASASSAGSCDRCSPTIRASPPSRMLHPTAAASARPSSASSPDWPQRTTVALVAVGAQQDHAVGEGRDPVACEREVERRPAALGRLTHERLQRVERLGAHARPPGPLVPGPDLADDPLVDHREPGRAQERLPLRPSIGADVGGVATPLDLRDERVGGGVVVAEDVLHQEGAAGPEHPVHLADGRGDVGEVVRGDPARDRVERPVAEGERLHVAGGEADVGGAATPDELTRGAKHGLRQVEVDDLARDAGEGQRRVTAARGHVERAAGPAGADPREEALEVVASRVARARPVGRGARTELRLDATGVGVAHVRLARSARGRKRKSVSSGERAKRREASSRGLTRAGVGRGAWRGRGEISGGAVSLKKKKQSAAFYWCARIALLTYSICLRAWWKLRYLWTRCAKNPYARQASLRRRSFTSVRAGTAPQ